MKIAQLTPGSGYNFYCENCLRDITLIKALRNSGHDIFIAVSKYFANEMTQRLKIDEKKSI